MNKNYYYDYLNSTIDYGMTICVLSNNMKICILTTLALFFASISGMLLYWGYKCKWCEIITAYSMIAIVILIVIIHNLAIYIRRRSILNMANNLETYIDDELGDVIFV
jgi:hypothetical protein